MRSVLISGFCFVSSVLFSFLVKIGFEQDKTGQILVDIVSFFNASQTQGVMLATTVPYFYSNRFATLLFASVSFSFALLAYLVLSKAEDFKLKKQLVSATLAATTGITAINCYFVMNSF